LPAPTDGAGLGSSFPSAGKTGPYSALIRGFALPASVGYNIGLRVNLECRGIASKAGVAQLVEQRIRNAKVGSSTLFAGTSKRKGWQVRACWPSVTSVAPAYEKEPSIRSGIATDLFEWRTGRIGRQWRRTPRSYRSRPAHVTGIHDRTQQPAFAAARATLGLLIMLAAPSALADPSPAEAAAHRVLERVLGTAAAAQISLTLGSPPPGPSGTLIEEFTISGVAGSITVEATSPSALTQGAGWYLKYVAHADLMLRGKNPVLPPILPAPPRPIHRSASVPNRYALNDTNDGYTDPNLLWEDWENQLDLMALHGINEVYVTVGTDAVYHQLLQKYGYGDDELRGWIPRPAHQPWWLLQNMFGDDSAITGALLAKRAALGRRITDRARELGMTPVLPGYWGTVPTDFAARNAGADVIAQGSWVGYARPGWLNPDTSIFRQVAADYYAISAQVLGASTMYKMDPLHEGGQLGHADLARSATAIESALQSAHPGATWVIIAWQNNPAQALLEGVTNKSRLLLLATEADRYATWDSGQRWGGVPYAFGSIYNYGGHTILGANAATIVDRWFSDQAGPNAAQRRGVAIFPEAWTANPAVAELMSELPWQPGRFALSDWLREYAIDRYGTDDVHALNAWAILGDTIYATETDGDDEAQESLFNGQPSLTAKTAQCCTVNHMRYSGPDVETAWSELLAAAPSVTQAAAYQFDLADLTRQVIANRARVLLPLIRKAYDNADKAAFATLSDRWATLIDTADRIEGTNAAFMLGPRLDNAQANGSTPAEQKQLMRDAVILVTNWGTKAGFDAGLRDYANRDWNCLTGRFYKARWSLFFDSLKQTMAGATPNPIDWYQFGDTFANPDHLECASAPSGDIMQMAADVKTLLDAGPETSSIPAGWRSYTDNDALFRHEGSTFSIDSAGADLWQDVNQFGFLYQPASLRDGGSLTVHVASLQSEGNRPWARAGLMAGTHVTATHPGGFLNIAITPGNGCVFSWAKVSDAGLRDATRSTNIAAASWVRLSRLGDVYIGACSADGIAWTIVGSAVPGEVAATADVGMFASAANGGASDRFFATFDHLALVPAAASPAPAKQVAIEFFHAGFRHYFISANPDEVALLDAGVFTGWARTGEGFNVYTTPDVGLASVCRFLTTAFPPAYSHFYAPRGLGCESTFANKDWQFEGDVFYTPLPNGNGACPLGTAPVYRLYNNGQGGAPNHRFTTSVAVRAQMLAAGYIAEGPGLGVGMCSPN
jgi:Alpha-N-acetylglucosaminidase (NAGLU) tim-barrel domain/Alpha-N-acetylglucosaminidase (NAGLU) C-terminal domain/Alpha-N-acetylglucosaminidase (NAGLU) N-terminal domain/Repeat of unknown function (DUF5648)